MRVDEVGIAGCAAGGAREPGEHQRQGEDELWPPAQVAGNACPVCDPEVPKARRRDDLHLDITLPEVFDLVGDEQAGDVPRVPGVRRRQDRDLQEFSRRPKTIGVASANRASA